MAEKDLTLQNLKQEKQISIESNETTELNESIRYFRCNITGEMTTCETCFNIICGEFKSEILRKSSM